MLRDRTTSVGDIFAGSIHLFAKHAFVTQLEIILLVPTEALPKLTFCTQPLPNNKLVI